MHLSIAFAVADETGEIADLNISGAVDAVRRRKADEQSMMEIPSSSRVRPIARVLPRWASNLDG